MYKISVIIPIFNVGDLLKDCLYSIINQTIGIENIQVICINDASPRWEEEKEIQAYWYQHYPNNFLILQNSENLGQGMSRNKALKWVKGEYVHFIDSDDAIEPNLYLEAYQQLKKTHSQLYRMNYYRNKRDKNKHEIGNSSKEGLMDDSDKTRNLFYAYPWLNITDVRLIHKMKRFPTRGIYEDMVAIPTLFSSNGRFYQTNKVGYYYRINPFSTTQIAKSKMEERDAIKIDYLYNTLLDFVNKEYFPLDYGILISQFFLVYMTSLAPETFERFHNTMITMKDWAKRIKKGTHIRFHPDSLKDYGWKIAVLNWFLLVLWKWNFYYLLFFIRKFLGFIKKRTQK